MTRNRLILVLVLVVVGGAALALQQHSGTDDAAGKVDAEATFAAVRGDLNITITENGTLVAKESQGIKSEIRGNSKIEWLTEEGAQVEEGDVVCRLDITELKKYVEELELNVMQAQANLDTAKTELEIQKADIEAEKEKVRIALEKAQNELDRYEQGEEPKTRRGLEIAIRDADTAYAKAKQYYEDSVQLHEDEFITETQLEEDRIGFEKATVQKEGAALDLEMYEKFTYPMTLQDKRTAVADAKRAIETAEKRSENQKRQKEVNVEQAQKRLDRYQEQLEERKEMIEKSELKAPCPGIVIYGDPKEPWYNEQIKVGGEIWSNVTLITIPDLRVMQVKLSIHEADIIKVKKDQTVKVTMDTYPGMVLDAKVSKIASIAGGGAYERESEVKKFAVEVTMDENPGVELKPGISAKAEIFIEKKTDVLYVPIQCVFLEEGQHHCYVMTPEGPVKRNVKPGSNNDSYLEILEGLAEGDEVLLYNPNLPTQGTEESAEEEGSVPPPDGAGEPAGAPAGA